MAVMPGSVPAGEPANTLGRIVRASARQAGSNAQGKDRQASPVNATVQPNQAEQIPAFAFGAAAEDPNFPLARDGASTRELFFKMMLSVVLVVGLGAAAIYASRKLMGKITNLPGKRIRIVETTHLGPRKAIHLLRVGDRCLLLGSTNESITKLADLTTDFAIQERVFSEGPPGPGPDPSEPVRTGGSGEFGSSLESADALADLSTAYTENN